MKTSMNPIMSQLREEWEQFMKLEYNRPEGLPVYEDIFKNGWLFPLQRINETRTMIQIAQTLRPQHVMEIGSDKGGGFYHWVKGLLPGLKTAVAIEYSGIPFDAAFQKAFSTVDFKFVHGSSYAPDTVAQVEAFMTGRRFDCVFIDGDKSQTRADFNAYVGLVRPGGLVFIHDVEESVYNGRVPNPSAVFYELRKYYSVMAILDGREGMGAEGRQLEGVPVDSGYENWLRIWKWNSCGVGVVRI
jgi:predicted O-methyltransferase YrrM